MIDAIFTTVLTFTILGLIFTPISACTNEYKAFKCIAIMTVILSSFTIGWALYFGKV